LLEGTETFAMVPDKKLLHLFYLHNTIHRALRVTKLGWQYAPCFDAPTLKNAMASDAET
jgi:hypothetical protein